MKDGALAVSFSAEVADRKAGALVLVASREAASQDPRVSPHRGPHRGPRALVELPAFDTDWDVPAFQRKGQ